MLVFHMQKGKEEKSEVGVCEREGGRENEMAAINLLCDDSRSSETSNQAHLSERARKKKTSSLRRRCGSPAISLKAAEMPSCTFHSKSPG